jgi:hypothetical protein
MTRSSLLILFLAAFILTGCQTSQMVVPPALATAAEPMEVTGANPRFWNRPIAFGPWATAQVREGSVWQISSDLLPARARFSSRPYRLELQGPDGLVQVECMTRQFRLARDGWSFDPTLGNLPILSCGFHRLEDGQEWSMSVRQQAIDLQGTAQSGTGIEWTIRSLHRLDGVSIRNAEPVGYEILEGDRTLAAVETVNRGRVWIDSTLPPATREQLASIASALLLFDFVDHG